MVWRNTCSGFGNLSLTLVDADHFQFLNPNQQSSAGASSSYHRDASTQGSEYNPIDPTPLLQAVAIEAGGVEDRRLEKNQQDAIKYCADQGAHLPSAREFLRLSRSLGSKGFIDVSWQDWALAENSDRLLVDVKSLISGSVEIFFFSKEAYQKPITGYPDWHTTFWTSSIEDTPNVRGKFGMVFDAGWGGLGHGYPSDYRRVICFPGR